MKADFEKGTKICSRCRKELPLNMFGKHKSKSDGLNVYCKECSNIRQKKQYRKDIEHSREKRRKNSSKRVCTFQKKGRPRGNSGMLKRDYELTEEQLRRRNAGREYHKNNRKRINAQGILIWYDGKLQDLDSKEYRNIMSKEYNRQRTCAIRGCVTKVTASEHFLFDFDLEQMLKDNAYNTYGKRRCYITKWWKGEIRHWTVNDGVWRE